MSPGIVPVFPLPNAVLFPNTVLGLHVFEPRYRQMVEHVRAGEGLIAIALLQPGYEPDYMGSPAFHSLATVGRISGVQRRDDGTFDLNVVGLARVDLHEIPSQHLYRIARFEPRAESAADDEDPVIRNAKLDLLATQGYLMRELTGDAGPGLVVDDRMPFAAAVNGACANLPEEPPVRQGLLAIDDLMQRHHRVVELLHEALSKVLRIKNVGEKPGENGAWVN